ncbi:hypothetical protein E4U46_000195 [Claviceps purpurea]|nr:hypothetical protein E4U46_000195 [Claviceps purpurea]
MARLLRTPPSLPTPTIPRTAAATIAFATTIILRAWGCRATAYHKITSILETGSVLKTTDFDMQRFVDHQHFIILRRYDYVSQQSFTKRGSQWRVDRKRRRLARVAAPGTNYPTATTLEPLGQSASLLIKVLFLVLHKLRCERPLSSGTIHDRPTVTFCESASQFLLGGCYIPFPGPALKEPNVVYRVFLSRFR